MSYRLRISSSKKITMTLTVALIVLAACDGFFIGISKFITFNESGGNATGVIITLLSIIVTLGIAYSE